MDFSIPPPNYPPQPRVQLPINQVNQAHHSHYAKPLHQPMTHSPCATPGTVIGPDPRFSIPPPPINNQFRMQTIVPPPAQTMVQPPVLSQTPVPLPHTAIHQPHNGGQPMMYPAPVMTPQPVPMTPLSPSCGTPLSVVSPPGVTQSCGTPGTHVPSLSAVPQSLSEQDIPDMRPQFLSTQFHVQPGQLVMLPPLTGDRSMQTIQILTPVTTPVLGGHSSHSGHSGYNVQTLVLPVMKVAQSVHLPPLQHPDLIAPPAKQESVIQEEEMFLNKIDDTGLPQVMQGIDLDKVKQFAAEFKAVRIKLGLTQSQVGAALNSVTGHGDNDQISVSQSTICRFEKLEITALQVKKLLPVLQSWMAWAQQRHDQGLPIMNIQGLDIKEFKKRKRRTVFIKETVDALNQEFEANTNPSSLQLAEIAEKLGLCKETTRVWFCNKRQQLKKCAENVENSSSM